MNKRVMLGAGALCGATVLIGQMNVGADTVDTPAMSNVDSAVALAGSEDGVQPDVYVWLISGLANWGPTGSKRAYSVGTTSCNQGNQPLLWTPDTSSHPVIGQGMWRLAPGQNGHNRIEMIGLSWLKHGFCALDFNDCGTCQGTGCQSLGIGCSDPYTAARNGSQGPLGPRWQVNATTGSFNYPPATGTGVSNNMDRRMQVETSDVSGGTTATQKFFIDAQYIHPQDAPADGPTAHNNVSYREVSLTGTGFASTYIGNTVQFVPAPVAWSTADPTVGYIQHDIPNEGRLHIFHKAYDNGDGTWDYEYLVYNQNYFDAVGAFGVQVPDDVELTNVDFHDVHYHSGDGFGSTNFEGTDWPWEHTGGVLTWSTEPASPGTINANAIRWGTGYNFRFTANTAPMASPVAANVGVWNGGAILSGIDVVSPQPCGVACKTNCPEDLDGSGDVGFSDILQIIGAWGPCAGCPEDLDGSGDVGFSDVLAIIGAWGACP